MFSNILYATYVHRALLNYIYHILCLKSYTISIKINNKCNEIVVLTKLATLLYDLIIKYKHILMYAFSNAVILANEV